MIVKRRPMSEEHKKKISIANKGKKKPPFSDEHRRRIGEASKRRPINWKAIEAMRQKTLGNKFMLGHKHSPEIRKLIGDAQRDETHHGWKGDNVGYSSLHAWVVRKIGKADHCEMDKTHKSTRYHLANKSGKYKRDLKDWIKLCPSCHKKQDLLLKTFASKIFFFDGKHYTYRIFRK